MIKFYAEFTKLQNFSTYYIVSIALLFVLFILKSIALHIVSYFAFSLPNVYSVSYKRKTFSNTAHLLCTIDFMKYAFTAYKQYVFVTNINLAKHL